MNYFEEHDKKNKIRNAFVNNLSVDISLSKAQLSEIIQSGGFLGSTIDNLGKKSTNRPCCSLG